MKLVDRFVAALEKAGIIGAPAQSVAAPVETAAPVVEKPENEIPLLVRAGTVGTKEWKDAVNADAHNHSMKP